MTMANTTRRLKVYSKYRQRTYDNTVVPEIRLEGRWLEKSGFSQGQKVVVEQERGRLIIRLENSTVA